MTDAALADATAPGFADPARDSAEAFRAILDAMARPGTVRPLGAALAAPAPLTPAAAAAALTLADADAPLWLPEPFRGGPAEAWLRLHSAAAPAERPEAAAFALGPWPLLAPVAARLPIGTAERPDRSATLILMVETLAQGDGARLSGPGLAAPVRLETGLPPAFWEARAAAFPLGLDVLLCCGERVAALPRTTRVEA